MIKLQDIIKQIDAIKNPPVHSWRPSLEQEIDLRIDCLGNWFHEGQVIQREKLVVLFSSILWHEHSQYSLVTPAERCLIKVEDVPFIINLAEFVDSAWVVTTNTKEKVVISESNPVELRYYGEEWIPYVNIRYDLWGRVNRSIYYQWVTEAMENNTSLLNLTSQNYTFEVAKVK